MGIVTIEINSRPEGHVLHKGPQSFTVDAPTAKEALQNFSPDPGWYPAHMICGLRDGTQRVEIAQAVFCYLPSGCGRSAPGHTPIMIRATLAR